MAGTEIMRNVTKIATMGGDGTRVALFRCTLDSTTPLTVQTRILDILDVQISLKTNAGATTGVIWSAGTNAGEIDIVAAGSSGEVVIHVRVEGRGEVAA